MPTPATARDLLDVLIVDDDAGTRDVLSQYCHSLGAVVATAENGRAALAAITKSPTQYRVILTDVCMPGADGFEVLQTARAANPSCYVVMMTGYATLDSAIRAVREGAYDYLPKPFALGQLEVVLRRIRDRMALEDENRMLTRQMHGREPAAARTDVTWRLDGIEERLTRIEELLRAGARRQ